MKGNDQHLSMLPKAVGWAAGVFPFDGTARDSHNFRQKNVLGKNRYSILKTVNTDRDTPPFFPAGRLHEAASTNPSDGLNEGCLFVGVASPWYCSCRKNDQVCIPVFVVYLFPT